MKSHNKSLLDLVVCVYRDAAAKCSDDAFCERDLLTLRSRVEREGLSFLTITLPSLGGDLEQSLSDGWIGPTCFRAFRKYGKAPAFMRGFFDQVFDKEGRLLNEPSVVAVEGIRQVAYTLKKLNVPCSSSKTAKALDRFKEDEQIFESPLPSDGVDLFYRVSRVLWDLVLSDISTDALIPKHGPGATGEKLSPNEKYGFGNRWHERLEVHFPSDTYVLCNASMYDPDDLQSVKFVKEEEEQPVRVIPVPKTLKGPRIIAIEPACMQYAQQGISRALVDRLETHPLTSGHVNFRDQKVNRRLAKSSSKDGRFATLDLSSASDRVPYAEAISMFDGHPLLKEAISACRSTKARMPDGEIVPLKKFASMGSALCFPVEAMYFYTICIVALLESRNLSCTLRGIQEVSREVYVYGDDILVPVGESDIVIETLHKYYCKVNVAKSFTRGKFRESCGMDAFDGYEVTPTYVRQVCPENKQSHKQLISWVKTSNQFYLKGYWLASSFMLKCCEGIIGELPVVGETCSGLGKVSYQNGSILASRYPYRRTNRSTQSFEVRTYVPSPVKRDDPLDGIPALLKCLLRLEDGEEDTVRYDDIKVVVPISSEDHLARTARHGAVTLKRRWVSPV